MRREGETVRSQSARQILCIVAWNCLALLVLSGHAGGQEQQPTEYQLKAAYLYNFAKFVEWPANSFSDPSAPLAICVYGRDPFGPELRDVTHDKVVNGRRLEVSELTDLRRARSCHILFIASSEKMRMGQVLEALKGTGILTVGDSKGLIEQGVMINFVLENDRVQFEVNRKAADQAGLKISSKLLSVAKSVTL